MDNIITLPFFEEHGYVGRNHREVFSPKQSPPRAYMLSSRVLIHIVVIGNVGDQEGMMGVPIKQNPPTCARAYREDQTTLTWI